MNSASLAIVTSSTQPTGALLLTEKAKKLGYNADMINLHDNDVIQRIEDADAHIFRISPSNISYYQDVLPQLKGVSQGTLRKSLKAFDKLKTYETLSMHGFSTPKSYVIKQSELPRHYPVVVKILNGNQGEGVELVRSVEDFEQFVSKFSKEPQYLAQEFIAEADGIDARLFVVGSRCVAAMQRTATTDDFRANLHLGGIAQKYTPTDDERQLAINVTKTFGLAFAGVDIINSKDGPVVLEVNPSPGFGIQSYTDVDIAETIIKEVMNA